MAGRISTPEYDPPDDEDDEDEGGIEELFRQSGPEDDIVLHHKECETKDGVEDCICIPITLRRGAKA